MRDVANLSWKLAWVLDGRAADRLLDSYEQERAPQVRAVVASSIRVGELIDRLAAAEANGERFDDNALEANATRRIGWMPGLHSGLMPAAPPGDPGPVGDLLAQPRVRLRGGPVQRLDDALGGRLAVISTTDPSQLLGAEARAFLARLDARLFGPHDLEDLDGWLDALLARHPTLIVRPDGYILGAADVGPAVERQLEALREALGPTHEPAVPA
jgi:3-(3-hydroxy-phenyl)propionate hydroxylase